MISSWIECGIEGDLDGLKALYAPHDFEKYAMDVLLYAVHFNYPDVFDWVLEKLGDCTIKHDVLNYILSVAMKSNKHNDIIIGSIVQYKSRFEDFDEITNRLDPFYT